MNLDNMPKVNEIKNEILETVWKLVKDTYPLFESKHIKWDDELIRYKERLSEVSTYAQLYELVDRMLLELRDPHTRVIYTPYQEVKGVMPLILSCINGEYYVNRNPNGNILKPGMKIRKMNERCIEAIEQEVFQRYQFQSESHMRTIFLKMFSEGKLGTCIQIEAEDQEGKWYTEQISMRTFQEIIMEQSLSQEALQNSIKLCQVKEYEERIGYIRIITFRNEDVVKEMQEALLRLKDKKFLIVDVRDNDGGVIQYARSIAEMISLHKRTIGSCVKRKENADSMEFEEPSEIVIGSTGFCNRYDKIILLCNEFTMSSAEFIFLKALQGSDEKIVTVGTKTGGLAHRASVYTLFDGTKIQVTTSKYMDLDGVMMQEEGMEPDIVVQNSVKSLILNQDEQLKYALSLCSVVRV